MLIVSVVDCAEERPVYRLSASRQRPGGAQRPSEVEVNHIFVELLESLIAKISRPIGRPHDRAINRGS